MAEVDRLTVTGGVSTIILMENAGAEVAREIGRRWSPGRAAVLCGTGGNGGDGFVAARHLSEAGWTVRVASLGRVDDLAGATRHHAELWRGRIEPLAAAALEDADLVVDALFGAGLDRPLDGASLEILTAVAKRRIPVVAIDVPSGVMGDSGASLGAVQAALTVTFFRKKPGHLLLPGKKLCGELRVADIGMPPAVLAEVSPDTFENGPEHWLAELPRPEDDGNKFTRGHALVCGGYPTTGAARMAARAAARAGAGLTTVVVPSVALPIYAGALTSIMVRAVETSDEFDELIKDPRLTAFLLGPGAGVGEETRLRALALLATGRATLLDADALTSFRENPSALDQAIKGPCVLTPHDGEFARIFDPSGDKLSRARRAARRSGAIIVLKGADTVVAAPDGRAVINANAPAALATAGAGDVLGGIILGLLAQGMEPFLAAAAGVWLHGAAAVAFGPGLIAEDLPDLLPGVFRQLENRRLGDDHKPADAIRCIRRRGSPTGAAGAIKHYGRDDT